MRQEPSAISLRSASTPRRTSGGIGEGGMVLTAARTWGAGTEAAGPRYGWALPPRDDRPERPARRGTRLRPRRKASLSRRMEPQADRERHLLQPKLADLPITLPKTDGSGDHVFHLYVIRVERETRSRRILKEKGIASGIYYPLPLHLQPCFAHLGYKPGDCSVAEDAALTSLAIPVFPELKKAEKEYIVDSIRAFFGK